MKPAPPVNKRVFGMLIQLLLIETVAGDNVNAAKRFLMMKKMLLMNKRKQLHPAWKQQRLGCLRVTQSR